MNEYFSPTSERGGNNLKRLKDFCLTAKGRVRPWLSYMCRAETIWSTSRDYFSHFQMEAFPNSQPGHADAEARRSVLTALVCATLVTQEICAEQGRCGARHATTSRTSTAPNSRPFRLVDSRPLILVNLPAVGSSWLLSAQREVRLRGPRTALE